MRIGILAHEFLINIGANDLLRNILRGLNLNKSAEIFFLCPLQEATLSQEELTKFYSFYAEVAPSMVFVPCHATPDSYILLKEMFSIDIFLPTILPLPEELCYITYWPDCQPKYLPEFFDDESQAVRDRMISALLRTDRPMIINSRDAKNDMIKFYDADPSLVFELPFAPISDFDVFIPRPELLTKYELPQRYFIVSNQMWVHKSAETVLQAIALLKGRGQIADVIFTGRMEEPRRPEYIQMVHDAAKLLGVADKARFLGYIPKRDQIEIMKHAVAVVQPTLFEGGPGGGSVYDAHSLGLRCIVTDLKVNRELPKNNLVSFFPPRDYEKLATLMHLISEIPYVTPPYEDLQKLSKESTLALSRRLYRAIDKALAISNASVAAAS